MCLEPAEANRIAVDSPGKECRCHQKGYHHIPRHVAKRNPYSHDKAGQHQEEADTGQALSPATPGKEVRSFLSGHFFTWFPPGQNTLDMRLYGEVDLAE